VERSDLGPGAQRACGAIWRTGRSLSLLAALAASLVLLGYGGASPRAAAAATSTVKTVRGLSTTNAPGVPALVSVKLAALGLSVTSPRGPYRARPAKIMFDLGGYYGAATRGLWIDHLTWVDWGQPIAYASGIVHARAWPSDNFTTTAGGIMLDQLQSCGSHSYYTMAVMVAPAGFPANAESAAYGESEQALTACS
jgi:hypothetical protein